MSHIKDIEATKNDKIFNIGLLFIVGVTYWGSILLGFLLFLCWIVYFRRVTLYAFLYVPLLLAVMAFTQYTTQWSGDYDILRYYASYDTLSRLSLRNAILFIGLNGDWLFYSITYLISQLWPDDPRMMSLFFCFGTCVLMILAYRNIALSLGKINAIKDSRHNVQLLLWCLCFVSVINTPSIANIYRQYFAVSLFLWGFSRSLIGQRAWPLYVAALFAHWSMVMYITPVLLVRREYKLLYGAIPLLVIIGLSGILNPVLDSVGGSIARYAFDEELGVDRTLIVINAMMTIGCTWILCKYDEFRAFRPMILIFLCFVCLFIRMSTLTTRLYYAEAVFITILAPLLYMVNTVQVKERNIHLILFIIFATTFLYNIKNLILSDFSYQLFSENLYMKSISYILHTKFPVDML